jgi:hypothetical protein
VNITQIIAGDTLQFRTAVPDYPANAGYTLTYRLVPRAAGAAIEIEATADGAEYIVAAAAAATAAWAPGEYAWHAYVEKDGARYTRGTGLVTILPDPAAVAPGTDSRSQARKAVDDLKVALAAWNPLRRSYSIGDTTMTFNGTAEILRLLSYWEAQLAGEDAANAIAGALKSPHRVYVRSARG